MNNRERSAGTSARIRFMLAMAIDATGSGMYLPVSLLYFHHLLRAPMPEIGAILTAGGLFQLVGNWIAGRLIDRFGARAVVGGGYLIRAVGFAGYPFVRSPVPMFAAIALVAIGNGSYPPAVQAFIAAIAQRAGRDKLIGAQRSLRNAGLGVGGLLAGALLAIGSNAAYQGIVLGDAASFVLAAVLIGSIAAPGLSRPVAAAGRPRGGYRVVLRDRPFLALTIANLPTAFGYMALSVALPVYITQQLKEPGSLAGVLYAVNTVGIAALQIPVIKLLAKHRRTRSVALGGMIFSLSFLLFALLGLESAGSVLLGGLFVATAMFTAGELLQGATASALVASAAPEQKRGRYFAVYQLSWALPTSLAPAVLTALLSLSATVMWVLLAVGVAGSALATLGLEPKLPTEAVRPWSPESPGGPESQGAAVAAAAPALTRHRSDTFSGDHGGHQP